MISYNNYIRKHSIKTKQPHQPMRLLVRVPLPRDDQPHIHTQGKPKIIMKRGIHTEVWEGHKPYNLITLIILIQTIRIDGEAYPDRLADHGDHLAGHLVCGVQPLSSASPRTWHIAQE